MENKVPLYHCTQPCSNCPYRTDAPVRLWHKEEFKKVLESESDIIGKIFLCHKKNGSACIGWLMKQHEQDLPSIQLRISLNKNKVTTEYLNTLYSPTPLYKDVSAMIKANFPELIRQKYKNKSIPCCNCGRRQTITFLTNALSAEWQCQECLNQNHVKFKIKNGITTKLALATKKIT